MIIAIDHYSTWQNIKERLEVVGQQTFKSEYDANMSIRIYFADDSDPFGLTRDPETFENS